MALNEIRTPKREFTREEIDGPKGPTGYPESFNSKIFFDKSPHLKPQKQRKI